jgi:GTP cyclohydrolase I
MNASTPDVGTPVSQKIRERLIAARKRYHANDNIAGFIQPGELELLLDEVEEKMVGVLKSLVIDTERDHNTGTTARRVAVGGWFSGFGGFDDLSGLNGLNDLNGAGYLPPLDAHLF